MNAMKILATLTLLSVASSAYAQERKSLAQYWQETGFSTSDVLSLGIFPSENCTHSLSYLEGCVAGLNALVASGKPALAIVPTELTSDPAYASSKQVLSMESFVLIEAPKENLKITPFAENLEYNRRRDALNKILAKMLASGQAAKIDFAALFTHVLPYGVVDPSQDALIASEVIDAYLTTAEDAHAHIDPTAELTDNAYAGQQFYGIGCNIQGEKDTVTITSPMKGGPSEKAGLKPNDVIKAIDGKPVAGELLADVVKQLKGPLNSSVRVTVNRLGKTLDFTVVRGQVNVPNVKWEMRNNFGTPTGYIRLSSFMDKTSCENIEAAIKDLDSQHAQSLVLDLRANGGGLVDQATCIGGLFVGQKLIVTEKQFSPAMSVPFVAEKDAITNLPLAVMIDAGSASASEILSGAIQDYKRGWVTGDRSFGKASVQSAGPFPGSNEKILFFHTIARFYEPSGRTNERVGILPDLAIPRKPNATPEELYSAREADLYPIALSAEGPAWLQPRPEVVARLEKCVKHDALPEKLYQKKLTSSQEADYQYLVTEKALNCKID